MCIVIVFSTQISFYLKNFSVLLTVTTPVSRLDINYKHPSIKQKHNGISVWWAIHVFLLEFPQYSTGT